MRTTASLGGHPVHMMLVHFPMAFLIGAFLLDAVAAVGLVMPRGVAELLLGIGLGSGVVAAVPGIVDWATTVRGAGATVAARGLRHAVLGGGSLALFAAGWFLRDAQATGISLALVLELSGTGLLLASASAGGALVLRDAVGVCPRAEEGGIRKHEERARSSARPRNTTPSHRPVGSCG